MSERRGKTMPRGSENVGTNSAQAASFPEK
jgi:hypothetical protein